MSPPIPMMEPEHPGPRPRSARRRAGTTGHGADPPATCPMMDVRKGTRRRVTHERDLGATGEPGIAESTGRAGDPQVAAALARLEELGTIPVAEHVAVFEDVHRRLTGVLSGLDEERAPGEGRG